MSAFMLTLITATVCISTTNTAATGPTCVFPQPSDTTVAKTVAYSDKVLSGSQGGPTAGTGGPPEGKGGPPGVSCDLLYCVRCAPEENVCLECEDGPYTHHDGLCFLTINFNNIIEEGDNFFIQPITTTLVGTRTFTWTNTYVMLVPAPCPVEGDRCPPYNNVAVLSNQWFTSPNKPVLTFQSNEPFSLRKMRFLTTWMCGTNNFYVTVTCFRQSSSGVSEPAILVTGKCPELPEYTDTCQGINKVTIEIDEYDATSENHVLFLLDDILFEEAASEPV